MVVVAGGDYTEHEFNFLSSVELLFLDELEPSWIMGPSLPKALGFGTMVEFQNTVVVVGGKGSVDGRHLYQVSISSKFYEQLLLMQIPRAQKRLSSQAVFCAFGICVGKRCS